MTSVCLLEHGLFFFFLLFLPVHHCHDDVPLLLCQVAQVGQLLHRGGHRGRARAAGPHRRRHFLSASPLHLLPLHGEPSQPLLRPLHRVVLRAAAAGSSLAAAEEAETQPFMVACIHPGPVLPLLAPFVSAASGSSGAAAPPPAAHPPGGGRAGRGCGGAEGSGSPPAGCVRDRGGGARRRPAGKGGCCRRDAPPLRAWRWRRERRREGGELGAGEAESEARRRCCLCPCPRRAPGPAAPLSPRRPPGSSGGHTAAVFAPAPPPSSRPPSAFLTAGARPRSRQGCRLARGRATRARVRVCCGAAWGAGKPCAPGAAATPSGVSRAGPSCSSLALSQRRHRSTAPS